MQPSRVDEGRLSNAHHLSLALAAIFTVSFAMLATGVASMPTVRHNCVDVTIAFAAAAAALWVLWWLIGTARHPRPPSARH